jgi:hypothetical protein
MVFQTVNSGTRKHLRYYEEIIMANKIRDQKIRVIWEVILVAILVIFLLTGCKTKTVLVPVKETKIEYRDRLRVDSVYNRDTVQIYGRNDTVFKEVIRWRERFRIDTVSVVRIDSIPYPVEVIREVNVLTKWQRLRLNALNIIVIIIVCYVIIKIRTL